MEPLYLDSETEVYAYMKNFLSTKPKAIQLDGSKKANKNKNVMIVFEYSVDGQKYKLLGDLSRKAMRHFIKLAEEQGSPALALRETSTKSGTTLILADTNSAEGWSCQAYVTKASDRLRKVG
jgi:uncharacterized protein YueI